MFHHFCDFSHNLGKKGKNRTWTRFLDSTRNSPKNLGFGLGLGRVSFSDSPCLTTRTDYLLDEVVRGEEGSQVRQSGVVVLALLVGDQSGARLG